MQFLYNAKSYYQIEPNDLLFNDTSYGFWKIFVIRFNYNGLMNQTSHGISKNTIITLPNPNLYYANIIGATYGNLNVTSTVKILYFNATYRIYANDSVFGIVQPGVWKTL